MSNDAERMVEQLRERGIRNADDLIATLETIDRSDKWVFVSCDVDEDGNLKPVNATGLYRDGTAAFAAGLQYEREWSNVAPDEDPVRTIPVPLFLMPKPADAD